MRDLLDGDSGFGFYKKARMRIAINFNVHKINLFCLRLARGQQEKGVAARAANETPFGASLSAHALQRGRYRVLLTTGAVLLKDLSQIFEEL